MLSVPMPLIAGWLSDRVGRRPVIIGVYVTHTPIIKRLARGRYALVGA